MSLRIVATSSILETNLADWCKVCDPEGDLLMHPGLLGAAEASMGIGTSEAGSHYADTHFWYLLAYLNNEPVGAACVTEYPLDTMVFADPWSQRFVARVRRIFPRYLKFRVTFCGLPISIAGSNLRVVPGVDAPTIVRALNDAVENVSRDRKTWLVIYKELDRHEAKVAAPLESAGYVRAESLPMNRVANEFSSFTAMLDAMRSHYRYKIARSRKKFAQSDLRLNRTTGRAGIAELYTPELHSLYERVTCQSEHRLEILPREFFLELAVRFPDEIVFTTITQGTRVLAFAWSLRHARFYRNLFVGIDYDHIGETDAYFNLMVEDLAYGINQSADEVFVGQSADDFKSRLGCTADPRYLFIKVTNRFLQWCFLKFQSSFLMPPPAPPQRDVFKKDVASVNSVAKV